ncbi:MULTISPECIES: DUF4163 domain-containing protein [unclassified Bradyrhizobium]|uniref:DUF3298 and DUF4163 domain-containing protein n=1 Tax=unclassified Bradyrhizobium TaxID=2631580 RepID=UPI0032E4CFD3
MRPIFPTARRGAPANALRLTACAVATWLMLFSPPRAIATGDNAGVTFKSKIVETVVGLDATIKADPPLAANLLAEGKRWAEKSRREAETEAKASPELFRDGNPWSFERQYATDAVVADRYVSITRQEYSYTGGAHPNTVLDTILWDRTVGKRISIRPFFTELADGGPTLSALRTAIIDALKAEKKARGVEDSPEMDWFKGIEPKLLKIGPVSLAPSTVAGKSSGLVFIYSPYAVGSYAEGSYEAFVPWERFKTFLTADGRAIFDGQRPPVDKAK